MRVIGLLLLNLAVWPPSAVFAQPDEAELAEQGEERPDDVPPPLRRLGLEGKQRLAHWIEQSGQPRLAEWSVHQILTKLQELNALQERRDRFPDRAQNIERRQQRAREGIQKVLEDMPPRISGSLLEILGKELSEAGVRLPAPWEPPAARAAQAPPSAPKGAPEESQPARRGLPKALLLVLAAIGGLIALRRRIASWIVRLGTDAPAQLPGGIQGTGPVAPVTPVAEGLTAGALPNGPVPSGYRIVRRVGEGGMGTVYEAVDVSLERRVAVKRMRSEIRNDPRERERFLKEARTVAKLRHPNIIDIHAIVENEGEIYLVFEYLEGRTLDAALAEGQPMDLSAVRRILPQICVALDYAHGMGIVHRDLKPSNIMLLPDGSVKVMDFGVARQAKDARDRLSMTNTVTGTPPYMAPEAETGVVRRESDLYGVGVCLYEMLTGERPFAGSGAGMLMSKMQMSYVPASHRTPRLPPSVDQVLAKTLQADPELRPRTAGEIVAAFDAALRE